MVNEYHPEYDQYIKKACYDSNENVKEMAVWAGRRLGLA
jgi:hypothetical protein